MAELALALAGTRAGLDFVVAPILKKLLADPAKCLGVDMVSELHELETNIIPQFALLLEAANKGPHQPMLEKWIQQLKDALCKAEDLLDEHEYNILKRKAESGKDSSSSSLEHASSSNAIMKHIHTASSRLSNLCPKKKRLLDQLKELKGILAKAKEFLELLGLPVGNNVVPAAVIPVATSIVASRVIGRDKDRDEIVNLLLTKPTDVESDSSRYSGVAIVGLGGMGKSTLAQHVYNDKRVEDHFDVRMWVCISRRLDVDRHTRSIIESAGNKECPRIDNLDTLQCKLRDILQKSNRYLLVLDDVWFEEGTDEMEWEKLLSPLVSQQTGSRVLVTSRSDILPAPLSCNEIIRLKDMEDTDILALFKDHAFSGAAIGDQRLREQLEIIAEKLAKRLGRSPLAAKTVGSRLSRKKHKAEWEDTLRINNLSDPSRALLWSYEKLDPKLQRCFLYCSLYPKGHWYDLKELVRMWIAEGLIDSCNTNKRLEDIGRDCCEEMFSLSFFQPPLRDSTVLDHYAMHDLVHDLAESLSKEVCFRLEDDKVTTIPRTVRHLSVCVKSLKQHQHSICKIQHLRTFVCIEPLTDDARDIFQQVLQSLKKLRVLSLLFYKGSELPESVGELKHLRYLDLSRTSISELPGSLCALYHMQFLQLTRNVKILPEKLFSLSKLRYFKGHGQILYIGKLTSLQELEEFFVQKDIGHEVRQLKDLNNLGGSLSIKNLENVDGKDQALEANLHQKNHLRRLDFEWSYNDDMVVNDSSHSHLEILEGLMPPPQIWGLTIKGYRYERYPGWLLDVFYFQNLEWLEFVNCSALEILPSNASLYRNCFSLRLENIPNLKTLPPLPDSLKMLAIEKCQLLMFISRDEIEQHDWKNTMMTHILKSRLSSMWEVDSGSEIRNILLLEHSSLKRMMILDADMSRLQTIEGVLESVGNKVFVKEDIIKAWIYCHEERIRLVCTRNISLPLVPPSGLRKLELSSCIVTDGALADCLDGLPSLSYLSLKEIMNLTTLPSQDVLQQLTKLRSLHIDSCWRLQSLGGLQAATRLSRISLCNCPSLDFTGPSGFLPSSLENLRIFHCLVAPDFLSSDLPHLKDIAMSRCRSSSSLSIGHLTSLDRLSLSNLPDLCFLEGLPSHQLFSAQFTRVPNLNMKCISKLRVQQYLTVSSPVMLNHMLSVEGCKVPRYLTLQGCKERSFSFEESADFSSVKGLTFWECEISSMPGNLKCFSCLTSLRIDGCPNLSSLPDLPSSLQRIHVENSELLKKSCESPDGESWPKIEHIQFKSIH